MNEDLSVFRDPRNNEPLRVADGDHLEASDGAVYPIIDGIPRFVPEDNYASDFGAQWNRFPRTQLDSDSGTLITEERLARCLRGELGNLRGKLVLEAGSGAGRFTEVLLKHGARLHSFDFSSAVVANARNNGASAALSLAQGDIRRIPYPASSYDYVICLGVIQHTPSPEESIRSLWRMVKPGGRLVIDHYRPTLWLNLPPPLGNAEKLYRWIMLKLPQSKRFSAIEAITKFWFPFHWKTRNSRIAKKILARLSPLHFYYPELQLRDRQAYYEWALLDTHDGTTDFFKHYRDEKQIKALLEDLGAEDLHVWVGGNGVEANCRKPGRGN